MDAGGTEKANEVPGLCDVSPSAAREKNRQRSSFSAETGVRTVLYSSFHPCLYLGTGTRCRSVPCAEGRWTDLMARRKDRLVQRASAALVTKKKGLTSEPKILTAAECVGMSDAWSTVVRSGAHR